MENEPVDNEAVVAITRRWIESIVVGLNLCPFARRVFQGNLIRYVVSNATDPEELLAELNSELHNLAMAPIAEVETTLLIHPQALEGFLDYNDFLEECDELVDRQGQRGIIQIASFHPKYQFRDTQPGDVENYTNCSPFPMLHLLREESVSKVAEGNDLLEIPKRNIKLLKSLGREKIAEMMAELQEPPA